MTVIHRTGKLFFYLLILLLFNHATAQLSRLDSLKKNITIATTTPGKLQAMLNFCDEWDSFASDTLKKYAMLARRSAIAANNQPAILLTDYYMAAYLFQQNRLDTALRATESVIVRAQKISPYNKTLVKSWILRNNILLRTSHYEELLKENYSIIPLAEQQHDTILLVRCYTLIGNVNLRLKKYADALKWHSRALSLMQSNATKTTCSFVFVNIAIVYYHLAVLDDNQQNEDSIETNLQRAIFYSRQGNSLTNLANALSMYGSTLAEYKKLEPAEAALTEALVIRKKIGDIYYVITDLNALSSFYRNSNNYPRAVAAVQEGLALARKNGTDFISLTALYSSLGEIYAGMEDYKKYSEVLNERMQLQDSFYRVNTAEAMSELETKYEVQKKENTIIQQEYAIEKKNYLVYGVLVLFLLGSIFSIILFNQNRKKQIIKMQLLQEEEKRMSLIAVATAEENERRRIAAELHDNLGSQLSYVSSNMDFIMDPQTTENKQQRLDRVNDTVKSAIAELRGTIWAMNKESLQIEEIADKLKLHVQHQLSHKPGMKLDVDESLPFNLTLSPVEGLNIFRIFQEAINNAVKYSGADTIRLVLQTTASSFCIALADNGQGFDTNAIYTDHYGLENMKERAKQIQAILSITSENGRGSRVELRKTVQS